MEQQAKPRMRKIGDGRYLVESSSQPGISHKVDVRRGRCGCRAGQFGRPCHHLTWARQLDAWYRRQQALLQAARSAPVVPAATPTTATLPALRLEESTGYQALMEAFV